jgi:hypothetical protein
MKRRFGILLAAAALLTLGGCVYTPGYYSRPGVAYDDGTANYAPTAGYAYGYGYYAPGYYADPWCCYGGVWPWIGLNFYGGRYYGGHGHWHGGRGWHGSGPHRTPHGSHSHGH